MPTGSEMNEQISQAYNAVMRDGTVPALGREAVKDIRSTIMEFFFGKPERGSEPGTPLNPLFYDIVAARNSHGPDDGPSMGAGQGLPTPSQVIDNPKAYLPGQPGPEQGQAASLDAAPDLGRETPAGPASQTPTPSDVIDNPRAYLPDPQQQNGREHDHGRDI